MKLMETFFTFSRFGSIRKTIVYDGAHEGACARGGECEERQFSGTSAVVGGGEAHGGGGRREGVEVAYWRWGWKSRRRITTTPYCVLPLGCRKLRKGRRAR